MVVGGRRGEEGVSLFEYGYWRVGGTVGVEYIFGMDWCRASIGVYCVCIIVYYHWERYAAGIRCCGNSLILHTYSPRSPALRDVLLEDTRKKHFQALENAWNMLTRREQGSKDGLQRAVD